MSRNCALYEILAAARRIIGCRVASAGCPAEALTRSGQGDFHHPALPEIRLASLIPRWSPPHEESFRYLPELRGHAFQRRGIGHVSLRKLVSPRAAFARPGPGCHPVPRRRRSYAALRLPCGLGRGFGCPSPSAYHDANAFQNRPCVPSPTHGASEAWGLGPPSPQLDSWTVRGLPGYWAILVPRATAKHPAGCGATSPHDGVVACCLQSSGTPGLPG